MEVIRDLKKFKTENSVITIGKFDGVHLGHRLLLSMMRDSENLTKVVFTFEPAADAPIKTEGNICDNKGKIKLLSEFNPDYIILYPFGKKEAAMSPERFVKDILVKKLGIKKLIVGPDFRFGKKGSGDTVLLAQMAEKYHFELVTPEKVKHEGVDISSTRIRNEIKTGNLSEAEVMLGHNI